MTRTVTSIVTCDIPKGMTLQRFHEFLRDSIIGGARVQAYPLIGETLTVQLRGGMDAEARKK